MDGAATTDNPNGTPTINIAPDRLAAADDDGDDDDGMDVDVDVMVGTSAAAVADAQQQGGTARRGHGGNMLPPKPRGGNGLRQTGLQEMFGKGKVPATTRYKGCNTTTIICNCKHTTVTTTFLLMLHLAFCVPGTSDHSVCCCCAACWSPKLTQGISCSCMHPAV